MNEQYLILLDLDGTTLYDWQTLSSEVLQTINKVREKGHIVAIATGRPYRSSKVFYDLLNLDTPIVNYNGALIHHPKDHSFKEYNEFIPLEDVLKVFDAMDSYIDNAFCEYYEDIYLYKEDEAIMPLVHPEGGTLIIGSFHETLKTNPNGFIVLAKPGAHVEIEEYIDAHFKDVLNHRNWGGEYEQIIEIYTPKTCKGNAMKILADYYQIPIERTIAIGDGNNDVEMIRGAGIGVAMENAVDAVKEVAKYNTTSNKNHGVAAFLTKYFNL